MAFGTEFALRIARQSSSTVVATALGSFHNVPFVSEGIVTAVPELISDTIRARYEPGPAAAGLVSAQGDVVTRPSPDQVGLTMFAALGVISSTQINSTYRHIFVPTHVRYTDRIGLQPFTILKYPGVGTEDFQFTDCCLNRLSIEIVAGQYLRETSNWICRVSSLTAQSSGTFVEAQEYTWNQASVSIGGVAMTDWESLTITIDNGMEMVPTLDGTTVNRLIVRNAFRQLNITGTADLPDLDDWKTFRAGSYTPLDVTIQAATISSGNVETLRFQIPQFRYNAFPIGASGPTRVTVGFEGRAVYHQGSGLAMMVTVINTRAHY